MLYNKFLQTIKENSFSSLIFVGFQHQNYVSAQHHLQKVLHFFQLNYKKKKIHNEVNQKAGRKQQQQQQQQTAKQTNSKEKIHNNY